MNQNPLEPPSGNDGAHDDGDGAAIVVPDDARELARDVEAWRREQRWSRRRRRLERIFLTRRWRDHGVPGPLIALILVTVALLGATISILTPRAARQQTAPVPLALAAPTQAPGTTHGLLPDVMLTAADGERAPARNLRPAVFAIVSVDCDCRSALVVLAQQATANSLTVYLVGAPAQESQLAELAKQASRDDVRTLLDADGGLIAAYQPHGMTVLPVHADGVTDAVVRDYTPGTRLGPELVGLRQAGPA